MKKKIMAALLAFALTVGPAAGPAGPVTIRAQEGQELASEDVEAVGIAEVDYGYGELEDGTLVITKYQGSDTDLVIPSEIGGKRVTGIGNHAFSGCSGLTSVTIPESVTGIGYEAFEDCSGLTSVTIPKGVTSIGSSAFEDCSGLTSVTIPEGVTSIENETFYGCNSLTSVTIPESVTSIGNNAFSYCKSLTSVTIPESVTSIEEYAFSGCSGLTSVTIPGSVTSIEKYAFENCSGLTSVTISKGVTSIGSSAFENCSGLTSVTIPESVTDIGEFAFFACSGLTSVTISESVTSIGERAFSGWTGGSLTDIQVEEGNANYASESGMLYNKAKTELICCPGGIKGLVTIPESVTSIGINAFYSCNRLTGVNIPESVVSIGAYAFSGCWHLTSVTIPESVTSIGHHAFNECIDLTSVTIPESVTDIGSGAFRSCRNLISVTIPESVTSIGGSAFSDCSGLTSVTIPKSVTSIGDSAFSDCSGLTSVTIPESVTSIGRAAFRRCDSLTDIQVEEGNANYASESGILYDKKKTTLIAYPGNMEGSFTLPKTVTDIEFNAFSSGNIKDIKIPEGIAGSVYVSGCSRLESLSVPSAVTHIESSDDLKEIFYAGSEGSLDYSGRAAVHYNVPASDKLVVSLIPTLSPDEPQNPGANPGGGQQIPNNPKPDTSSAQQKAQAITATDITKTYGAKPFPLGASALGGAALSYASSNAKVASVASNGTVTIKGCGVAVITVTAAKTKDYEGAQKTVRLTVKPKKAVLVSVKSNKKKTATVKWKRDKQASGYLIECATDKKFKKNKVKAEVKKNKTVTTTVKKLKGGKKYYVRICAYVKSGNTTVQGDFSKPKTVKVKK